MSRQTQSRQIADDYGNNHTYEVTQHPGSASVDLFAEVCEMLSEGLGELFNVGGKVHTIVQGAQAGRVDMDEEVDVSSVGDALHSLALQFIKKGGSQWLKQKIFAHTKRAEAGTDAFLPVSTQFDRVYQGNIGELGLAIWFVLDANYGPFFRSRLGAVWSTIASRLPNVSASGSTTVASTGSTTVSSSAGTAH